MRPPMARLVVRATMIPAVKGLLVKRRTSISGSLLRRHRTTNRAMSSTPARSTPPAARSAQLCFAAFLMPHTMATMPAME